MIVAVLREKHSARPTVICNLFTVCEQTGRLLLENS